MLRRWFRRWSDRSGTRATSRGRRVRLECEPLEGRLLPVATLLPPPEDGAALVRTAETRIVNGTVTSGFPSVGLVGDATEHFCSGTLIAPRYVLTAGHCAEGLGPTQGRFRVNGVTYATSRIFIHPNYNPNRIGSDAANDIAIFQLNRAVTGVTPSRIYRNVPRVGQLLTLVGFGAGGNGTTGHNGDFGIKRVGTTPIDGVTPRLIKWTFNNNQESNTAPGDSGGPAFLRVNNVYFVAGVTSGGDKPNAGIGDHSYDTRVDVYAAWIDRIVGSTAPAPTPTPTPSGDQGGTLGTAATFVVSSTGAGKALGTISASTDRDFFKFVAPRTGWMTINLRATSNLDPILAAYNSAGQLLDVNDDWGWGLDSRIEIWVTAGRTYFLRATGYGGSTGSYSLETGGIVRTRSAPVRTKDVPSFRQFVALRWTPPVRFGAAIDALLRRWAAEDR